MKRGGPGKGGQDPLTPPPHLTRLYYGSLSDHNVVIFFGLFKILTMILYLSSYYDGYYS